MDIILREAHSGLRWLVVLSTLVAIGWMAYGLIRSRAYDQTTYRVMTVFSSLVGAQWLLGIIFFVVLGNYSMDNPLVRLRFEHAGTMTLVLVVAHVHMMLKKRDDRTRYIGGLISVIVAMILVYVGVAVFQAGWAI